MCAIYSLCNYDEDFGNDDDYDYENDNLNDDDDDNNDDDDDDTDKNGDWNMANCAVPVAQMHIIYHKGSSVLVPSAKPVGLARHYCNLTKKFWLPTGHSTVNSQQFLNRTVQNKSEVKKNQKYS